MDNSDNVQHPRDNIPPSHQPGWLGTDVIYLSIYLAVAPGPVLRSVSIASSGARLPGPRVGTCAPTCAHPPRGRARRTGTCRGGPVQPSPAPPPHNSAARGRGGGEPGPGSLARRAPEPAGAARAARAPERGSPCQLPTPGPGASLAPRRRRHHRTWLRARRPEGLPALPALRGTHSLAGRPRAARRCRGALVTGIGRHWGAAPACERV